MDNKINEIRRKISFLRLEMLSFEEAIRKLINGNEDCSEAAHRLMGMRREMTALTARRDALGGHERLLNVEERLKAGYRPVSRKPAKGDLVRRG